MVAKRLDVALERRAQEVFQDALDIPRLHRDSYIEQVAGSDRDLMARVRSLVASYESTQTHFIDEPFISAEHLGEAIESLRAQSIPTIDRYEVLECIGAGGMGIVYEAEQRSPRRRVALKLLRTRRHSPAFLQRFQNEVEILGRLNHGSIAQVYEAGTHVQDGVRLPYYVMELVEGSTDCVAYCEQHRLTADQRLRLFHSACEAIQFGHMRGVVHLDLKPSNVLIDALGRVKIIDFGIAKAASLDVPDDRRAAGTPAYMSPEQRAGRPELIDARSDVYSLGCLLRDLFPTVMPSDLKLVYDRATAEHPTARYQTVQALADDIAMILQRRPVSVRKPSIPYRTGRLCVRRPYAIAALATGGVLLAACIVVAILLAIQNAKSSRLASDRAEVAQRALYRAQLTMASQRLAAGDKFGAREILLKLESLPAEAEMLARLADSTGQPWRVGRTVGGDEPVRSLVSRGDGFPMVVTNRRLIETQLVAGLSVLPEVQLPGVPLAVSQDGRLVLVRTHEGPGGEPAEVILVDRAAGELKAIAAHFTSSPAAAFSGCGRWCAASLVDATGAMTLLVDTTTLDMQRLDGVVSHICFAPTGPLVAIVDEQTVQLIDALSGEVHQIVPRQTRVLDIEISPDSSELFVATGAQIEIWDIGSGRRVREIELRASAIALNHDATRVVIAMENSVAVVDVSTGRILTCWDGLPRGVTEVAINQGTVWAGDASGSLWMWQYDDSMDPARVMYRLLDSSNGAAVLIRLEGERWILEHHSEGGVNGVTIVESSVDVPAVVSTRDNRAAIGMARGDVHVYDLSTSTPTLVSKLDVLDVEDQVGDAFVVWRHVALTEDGSMLIATVDIDPPGSSKTTVFDLRTHRLVWERSHQIARNHAFSLPRSGSIALVSSQDALLIQVRSGKELERVRFPRPVGPSAAHPTRSLLAVSVDASSLEVWDFSGPLARTWASSSLGSPIASVWWDASGSALYAVTVDGSLNAFVLEVPEPMYTGIPLTKSQSSVATVVPVHNGLWVVHSDGHLLRVPMGSSINPVSPSTAPSVGSWNTLRFK